MAFTNDKGQSVSYDCSDLIEELEEDIEVYGGDKIVHVITEEKHGVTLYKHYWIAEMGEQHKPKLFPTESIVPMTATALLEVYRIENSII